MIVGRPCPGRSRPVLLIIPNQSDNSLSLWGWIWGTRKESLRVHQRKDRCGFRVARFESKAFVLTRFFFLGF